MTVDDRMLETSTLFWVTSAVKNIAVIHRSTFNYLIQGLKVQLSDFKNSINKLLIQWYE